MNKKTLFTLCVTLGGLCALTWEVLWQIRISLAFGSSALGAAITLACLSLGLGIGAWLGQLLLKRLGDDANPLMVYGILELIIGVHGLFLSQIFDLLSRLDVFAFSITPTLTPALQFGAVFIAILPATAAMGATIPVFKGLASSSGCQISRLYAFNTLGATIGILAATFIGVPALGLAGLGYAIATVNVLVFILAVLTSGAASKNNVSPTVSVSAQTLPAEPGVSASLSMRVQLLVVGLTGFAVFALEVVWFRALRAALFSYNSSFALVLCAALLAITAGAAISTRIKKTPGRMLFLGGLLVLISTPLIERLDLFMLPRMGEGGLSMRFLACLILVGPAFVALSVALPWFLNRQRDPASVARFYFVNTAGSFVGATVCGWVLLPSLGVSATSWFIGGVICVATLVLMKTPNMWFGIAATVAAMTFAITQNSGLGSERVIGQHHYRLSGEILRHFDGPDVTASVIRTDEQTVLFIDGFMMASDWRVSQFTKWMAYIPALYLKHPPQKGLVICFGTGQTLYAMVQTDVAQVDIVDINPKVFEFADAFQINQQVLAHTKVRRIVMDGRAWIRRTHDVYDLITLEPPAPNFAGVNNLYSEDFYRLASDRLTPGGAMSQWVPAVMLSRSHDQAVVKAFKRVFPNAVLFIDRETGHGFVVGTKNPERVLDLAELGRSPAASRDYPWDELKSYDFYSSEQMERYVDGAPSVTDDNQLLAFGDRLEPYLYFARPLPQVMDEIRAAGTPAVAYDFR